MTGGRYGELNGARIVDFDVLARTLRVSGKTGSRDIILQSSAVNFFKKITRGRPRADFIFVQVRRAEMEAFRASQTDEGSDQAGQA